MSDGLGITEKILTLFYLWINARNDIRKRQIILWTVVLYTAAGIIAIIYKGDDLKMLLIVLAAALPGIFFSVASKGALGLGDVLMLISLGIMLDFWEFIIVFGIGLFTAAVYSGILFLIKKAGRKTEIPFVPFLLLGYAGGLCIW